MAHEHHGQSAPPPPFPPVPPFGPRRLVRRPDRGHIAGVCQGVAEYFNIDPLIVRIAAVVLLFTGPGFFAYLACWVFVPAEDGSMLVDGVKPIPEDKTTQVIGVGLIVLAASLIFGGWWSPAREWLWPLGLVAAGAFLLLRRNDDDDRPVPPTGTDPAGPTSPWAPPADPSVVPAPPAPAGATEADHGESSDGPSDAASTETDPATEATDADGDPTDAASEGDDPTAVTAENPVQAEAWAGAGRVPPYGPDPTAFAPVPPPGSGASERRRRGRFLGPLVFGALLLWGGIAWIADVDVQDGLAIGLCVIGAGFVLGAFTGGSRALVFPALLVGAALLVTSVVDIPWGGGIGDKDWEVETMSELEERYELAIGDATLDLGELRVPSNRDERVEVDLGIGDLTVIVPRGTDLDIDAELGAGEGTVLGRSDDGVGVDLDRQVSGSSTRGSLQLDLHVGLGQLEVRYADAA